MATDNLPHFYFDTMNEFVDFGISLGEKKNKVFGLIIFYNLHRFCIFTVLRGKNKQTITRHDTLILLGHKVSWPYYIWKLKALAPL